MGGGLVAVLADVTVLEDLTGRLTHSRRRGWLRGYVHAWRPEAPGAASAAGSLSALLVAGPSGSRWPRPRACPSHEEDKKTDTRHIEKRCAQDDRGGGGSAHSSQLTNIKPSQTKDETPDATDAQCPAAAIVKKEEEEEVLFRSEEEDTNAPIQQ
eukprot:scaffold4279_cov99-Isochrysis_galbana.AAC.7